MENVWALAALWVERALIATLRAIWFSNLTALAEIVELVRSRAHVYNVHTRR